MRRLLLIFVLLLAPSIVRAQTYGAAIVGLAPAASATDLFTLTGAANHIITITKVSVGCTQTTAGTIDVVFLKRSTADSAGTSTNPAKVPLDGNNPASSATTNAYTVNPTPGTLTGNVKAYKLACLAPATATPTDIVYENYQLTSDQGITLRAATDVFAINLNAQTVTGGNFDIAIEWTEH